MNRSDVYDLIDTERNRQQAKWGGSHSWGEGDCSSDGLDPVIKSVVMTEEVGEVARAVLDGDVAQLRSELVQVAAVAVAWIESL